MCEFQIFFFLLDATLLLTNKSENDLDKIENAKPVSNS